ncbi:MAG: hypothetical protein COB26_11990 [Piscirickettsiaceae bacterium]|nr:MAG: hypothetical protein COB26_11990 [Piscirickettsiaceae bacterium]
MNTLVQIVAIFVRIAAVIVFLIGLNYISQNMMWFNNPEQHSEVTKIMIVCFGIVHFLLSLFLWFFPLSVAKKIIPKIDDNYDLNTANIPQMQIAILAVVGISILAIRIPDLLFWLTYAREINIAQSSNTLGPDVMPSIYTTLLEITLGLWLMFKGRGLIGLVQLARLAGNK